MHKYFIRQFVKCVAKRVDGLCVRFKSIIILSCAPLRYSYAQMAFPGSTSIFHVACKNIDSSNLSTSLCVSVWWMLVSWPLQSLWLHNIMKRLFALCNSIIWVFFCRWLFGVHGTNITILDIDSDLMPISVGCHQVILVWHRKFSIKMSRFSDGKMAKQSQTDQNYERI